MSVDTFMISHDHPASADTSPAGNVTATSALVVVIKRTLF
jgi:hypothetical protein